MTKPFDATPKAMIEIRPADWPAFLGVPAREVEVVDADVSTVTAATDKVLIIRADEGDRIQHFDFQSGPDASVPRRTLRYNALLDARHQLPVESVVVLLAPKAYLRVINGIYMRRLPGNAKRYLRFCYRVIRTWELPVETVLQAGISVLPLAPISAVSKRELPGIIKQMKQRLDAEADRTTAGELWTATKLFLGLRYTKEFADKLLRGVRAMKESTTYQAILDEGRTEGRTEGRIEEVRETIRRLGQLKFKTPPPARILTTIDGIMDLEHLHHLADRILDVTNWEDLLAPSTSPSQSEETGTERKPSKSRRKKS